MSRIDQRAQRLHHLDALRVFAIALLIPYHAGRYLQKGLAQNEFLNSFIWFIHTWHMPLFFAISGYLAGASLLRSDAWAQIKGRLSRLGIPLVVGMVTVVPLANLAVIWTTGLRRQEGVDVPPSRELTLGNVFNLTPHHLWFLAYLVVITIVMLAATALARKLSHWTPQGPLFLVEDILDSRVAIPALALISAGILMTKPAWASGNGAGELLPDLTLLVYLGLFFGFGWTMASRRWLAMRVQGAPTLHVMTALGIGIPASILFYNHTDFTGVAGTSGTWAQNPDLRFAALAVVGMVAWSAIFGIWGLAVRYVRSETPVVRYLADASFWIFLVHIPILVTFQSLLSDTGMIGIARYAITVLGTLALSLATYAIGVRRTPIGRFLHGPRPKRPPRRRGRGRLRRAIPAFAAGR